ncbi:transmembrane protein 192-like [Ptychodera flava]|uniref:transmembrane protein 192-like n=1 Tax=Ptychodera flava TaxID=63121 RepID=UPI00396A13DD
MVSLGNNGSRQGGYFFDQDASLTPSVDDQEQLIVQLGTQQELRFKPIPTVFISIVQAILFVCMAILSYLLPYVIEPAVLGQPNRTSNFTAMFNDINATTDTRHAHMRSFSILVYTHAALWLVVALIERYLRYHHYMFRRNGYLQFYRITKNVRRVPSVILSMGNALMLVVVMLVRDLNLDSKPHSVFEPIHYLELLITLELCLVMPCIVIYIVRSVRFNREKAAPDVEQDDLMAGFLQSHVQTADIGFKDTDHLDDILEKQADMIRYLQQHNAHLGRRIMKLTAAQQNRT